jgi:hypothetical protein
VGKLFKRVSLKSVIFLTLELEFIFALLEQIIAALNDSFSLVLEADC